MIYKLYIGWHNKYIPFLKIQMSGDENLIAMNMKLGSESTEYFYKQGKLSQ